MGHYSRIMSYFLLCLATFQDVSSVLTCTRIIELRAPPLPPKPQGLTGNDCRAANQRAVVGRANSNPRCCTTLQFARQTSHDGTRPLALVVCARSELECVSVWLCGDYLNVWSPAERTGENHRRTTERPVVNRRPSVWGVTARSTVRVYTSFHLAFRD